MGIRFEYGKITCTCLKNTGKWEIKDMASAVLPVLSEYPAPIMAYVCILHCPECGAVKTVYLTPEEE